MLCRFPRQRIYATINPYKKGQALIAALVFLTLILIIATASLTLGYGTLRNVRYGYNRTRATAIAEAGIEYTIRSLNKNAHYSGTITPISFGGGEFETTLSGLGNSREITSTAYIPSKAKSIYQKSLRANLAKNTIDLTFNYGVQSGEGGIILNNNSKLIGNIYSNGNIIGAPGANITGTAIVAGGVSSSPSITYTEGDIGFAFGRLLPIIDAAQSFQATGTEAINKLSLEIKKTGNPGNALVYIMTDTAGHPSGTTIASGTLYSSLVTSSPGWIDITMNSTENMTQNSTYWIVFDASENVTDYWTWSYKGPGTFPTGTAMFSQSWTNKPWTLTVGDFNFKVFSGAENTHIQDVSVNEDLYAHTALNTPVGRDYYGYSYSNGSIGRDARARELTNCSIGRDAYADVNTCTVTGTQNPGSGVPDKPGEGYAISNSNINAFKSGASGSTITPPSGTYTVTGTTTLGPVKIVGNLVVDISAHLTLMGNIYVTGSFTTLNNSIIDLDPTFGLDSGVIVADGQITIGNNSQFHGVQDGSGGYEPYTYILLITTFPSHVDSAFILSNNSVSAILFAPNGIITMNNNTDLIEATAWRLVVANNSIVTYYSGLQNVHFTSGPGGSWAFQSGTWREVKL